MGETPFQVSALLIAGFKKASTQLNLSEASRAHMNAEVGAMWDRPGDSAWHPGHLFQGMTLAMVKVVDDAQMSEINYRLCRDQFGPIVNSMVRIVVALGSPSPHTVFGNIKPMIGLAIKGADVDYVKSGERSGRFGVRYPLAFPKATAHAWAGVTKFVCELVNHVAVLDRVETLENGHRFEVDLHW